MTNTNTKVCPKCDREIPVDAWRGLCPSCLATSLGSGLSSRAEGGEADEERQDKAVLEPRVPGYDLLQILGEGAAGKIWLARENHAPRREVALKILKPELVAGDAAVRFEAEMAVLSLMDHPGIARVFSSGSTDDGRPFFAMEKFDGAPITEFCEGGDASLRDRLTLFKNLCEAIAHAHRRGIIHRDLKPSNVLANGEAIKVIDFGIAKTTEHLLTDRTLLTRANLLLGTPAYMSPEQAAMCGDGIDTRSDVYSLGVILYELLTGKTPLSSEDLAALTYDEALRKVRTEDPPRPGSIAPGSRAVPPDLEWIALKALEKDPERRYETADALARDIGSFLTGDTVLARPPTLNYRFRKYVRRNRGPVIAALAVALALVAGTVVSTIMFLRAEDKADEADQNADLAERNEADGRRQFSHADFVQSGWHFDNGKSALAVAHLVRALRTRPENRAAAQRLLYILATQNWARPLIDLPNGHSISTTIFSPNGEYLFIAWSQTPARTHWDPFARMYSLKTGELVREFAVDTDLKSLLLAPDGKTLTGVSSSYTWFVWDVETGDVLRSVRGRANIGLRFSPDGRSVAAGFWGNGQLQVWDYGTGQMQMQAMLPNSPAHSSNLGFSPDGERIVFAHGKWLQVFARADGRELSPRMSHDAGIMGCAFALGGAVVSWSKDRTARVWDAATGETRHFLAHEMDVLTAAISPDGTRLLTGTGSNQRSDASGTLRLWDLASGKLIGTPQRQPGRVMWTAFSRDGLKAVGGSRAGELGAGAASVLDAWSGEPLMEPVNHPHGALSCSLDAGGSRMAISSNDATVRVYSLQPGAMQPTQLRHRASVWRAIFDDGGGGSGDLYSLTVGGWAHCWDPLLGELRGSPTTTGPTAITAYREVWDDPLRHGFQHRREIGVGPVTDAEFSSRQIDRLVPSTVAGGSGVASLAASDDGGLLAIGGRDGKVRLWSPALLGLSLRAALVHGEDPVTSVAIDCEGHRVASGDRAGIVRVWHIDGRRQQRVVEQKELGSPITALSFSPAGGTLAIGTDDAGVRLWWLGKDRMSEALEHPKRVQRLTFSPSGDLLASTAQEVSLRVWDSDTGEQVGPTIRQRTSAAFGMFVQWLDDEEHLVLSGSGEKSAKLFEVRTGHLAIRPMSHRSRAPYCVSLHPSGNQLLLSNGLRVWDLGTGEWLTPHLSADTMIDTVNFSGDGRRFVSGARHSGIAEIWDFPNPDTALPEWFLRFAEALVGYGFDPDGVLVSISANGFRELEAEAQRQCATDDSAISRWLRWLCADPLKRSISPESEVTSDMHVERLFESGLPSKIRQACYLRPGRTELVNAFGQALGARKQTGARVDFLKSYTDQESAED